MNRANPTTWCWRPLQRLADFVVDRMDLSGRLRRHMEQCPRCQEQALRYGRLGLAMRLIRTQPHSMGLLLEANRRALAMLRRDVRALPQAELLRTRLPKAPLRYRLSSMMQSVTSAAACLLVLLAIRAGILSSLTQAQDVGRHVVEDYCSLLDQAEDSSGPESR